MIILDECLFSIIITDYLIDWWEEQGDRDGRPHEVDSWTLDRSYKKRINYVWEEVILIWIMLCETFCGWLKLEQIDRTIGEVEWRVELDFQREWEDGLEQVGDELELRGVRTMGFSC